MSLHFCHIDPAMIAGHRVPDGRHLISMAHGLCHIASQEAVEQTGIVCVARTGPINQLRVDLRAAGLALTLQGVVEKAGGRDLKVLAIRKPVSPGALGPS